MASLARLGVLAVASSLSLAEEISAEHNGCLGLCGSNTVCGPDEKCEKGTCPDVYEECCKGPVCHDKGFTECVAAFDPFCHQDWDAQCVREAQQACGLTCTEPAEKTYSKFQFISYPMQVGYNDEPEAARVQRADMTCTELIEYLSSDTDTQKNCGHCAYLNSIAASNGLSSSNPCGWTSVETGCVDRDENNEILDNQCVQYYPAEDDFRVDMKIRLQLMRQAVNTAKNSAAVDHDEDVLKIFIAPEFYFRGSTGAYTNEQILYETDFFQQLREIASDPAFDDWMFIFGTIVGMEKIEGAENGKEYKVWNLAVIERGMRPSQEKLVFKEYISDIDFVKKLSNGQDGEGIELISIDSADGSDTDCRISGHCVYQQASSDTLKKYDLQKVSGHVFEMAGIKFGVEVCLDHLFGVLAKSLPEGEVVQIQLVTSAGMSPKVNSLRLPVGGQILITDGLNPSPSKSFIWTVTELGPDGHPKNEGIDQGTGEAFDMSTTGVTPWTLSNATVVLANAGLDDLVEDVFHFQFLQPEAVLMLFPTMPIVPL